MRDTELARQVSAVSDVGGCKIKLCQCYICDDQPRLLLR